MSSKNEKIKITASNIDDLKELISLIDQYKNKYSTSENRKVEGIVERYHKYQRRISDYHKQQEQHLNTNRYSDYVPGLVQLARESVLRHDFTSALKIVYALVNENNSKVADTLWKLGTASLIIGEKHKLVDLYVRQLYKMKKLTCLEVLLDYLLYLLTEGNLERSRDLIQDLKMYHLLVTNEISSAYRDYGKILFRAYQGVVDYLQWRAEIVKSGNNKDSETDFINAMLTEDSDDHLTRLTAEKAIDNLSCVINIPGVWDIFIVKIVEIQTFYGDSETTLALLKSYRTENPTNPNAHRYLYRYMKEHEDNNEDKLRSLTSFVKLDPSNPLAVDLYKELELLSKPEAISILFDYLDFDHCKDDFQAWTLLVDHLSKIYERLVVCEGNDNQVMTLIECWKSREKWWPLTTLKANESSPELAALKRRAQHFFSLVLTKQFQDG